MASLSRFWALGLAGLLCLLASIGWMFGWLHGFFALFFGLLLLLGIRDVRQEHHAVLRNYPIIGHFRFLFEEIRPEIRQYFIESDTERVPFSREQRAIVYQRAKGVLDKRPFGSKADVYAPGYEWMNHSITPTRIASHDFRVLVGGNRKQPYSLSLFNISAMSFGALSPNAVLALNKGAKLGGFAHDTGEGSVSRYHREPGGDLIWELGSGYFGARNPDGTFSEERFMKNALDPQVKMIEIKMSQGAKPGHGGVLPAPKVTPEIAEA
ncbi:MAG: FMN-binding glutamate synthase family protein, partial [Betaproteobacteria bacterium]|nr:FMN-binding glutamate synthase family protein [Betaproteobacteria bacterium]